MRTVGQVLQKILAIIGVLKLPADIKELASDLRNHLYPLLWSGGYVVLTTLAGLWREASFEQIAMFILVGFILVYSVVFGFGILRERGVFHRRSTRYKADEGEKEETQVPRILSNEDLRQRCCNLSTQLFEFYRRQRQYMEDRLDSEHWDRMFDSPVREQKRADEIARHERWIIDQYGREFGSKMLTLSDDLAQAKGITPKDREIFKNPTKSQDIQHIAQHLDAICNRSEFQPQENSVQQIQGTEESQSLQEQRRQRIEEWRSVIRNFNFETEKFGATDTYAQMRPHLQGEAAQMFEGNAMAFIVNEAREDEPHRYKLLDEVARIEKEWGLI